jgi:hypothetical protein
MMKESRPGRVASSSSRGRGRTGGRGAVPRRSVVATDGDEEVNENAHPQNIHHSFLFLN